jgi:hypothetical protein
MSFLGRKGFTLLPSPDAISPSGSVHDKLELELELLVYSYLIGHHWQQRTPFWPPLSPVDEPDFNITRDQ